MKLYCVPFDSKTSRVVAMLRLLEIDCQIICLHPDDFTQLNELRVKSPLGSLPILESESLTLFMINPILKYLAKAKKERGFAGLLLKEEVQVKSN